MLINYIPNGKVTITVLTGGLINATSLYKKLFSRTTYKKNKLIKTKKKESWIRFAWLCKKIWLKNSTGLDDDDSQNIFVY